MPDQLNQYGYAQYGFDTYGEGLGNAAVCTLAEQLGFCFPYTRFQLYNENLGLYVFELNPTSYNIYPQRTTQQYSYILSPSDTADENYSKIEISLSWDEMPESMWRNLIPYFRKKVDGTSEVLRFWDANLGRFCDSLIKMEIIKSNILGGSDPIKRSDVSFLIREV